MLASFVIALMITLAIFSFMRYLISTKELATDTTEIVGMVELYKPLPDEPEQEFDDAITPPESDQSNTEPDMQPLTVSATMQAPSLAFDAMPAMDIAPIEVSVSDVGSNWSGPLSSVLGSSLKALSKKGDGGQDSKGYVEVVPYDTRQPNIPALAWQNKISGWVLVVFNVTKNGQTKNVRILDASPRGIFEDEVITAISYWRYSTESLKKHKGEIILTQKIQLDWQDYPSNVTY